MRLTDPSITLNFLGGDLEPGHSGLQTVPCDFIVNRSVKPIRQLLNGLRSSSNQIRLSLSRSCPSREDMVSHSAIHSAGSCSHHFPALP